MKGFGYTLEGEGKPVVGVIGKSSKKDVVVISEPQTPDRTLAIQGRADSPEPYLELSFRRLKYLGADYAGVPCNTAHYFVRKMDVGLPYVDMIRETAKKAEKEHVKKAGILATSGTVETKLYQSAFEDENIEWLVPGAKEQEEKVMEAIYGEGGIKEGCFAGRPSELLHESAYELMEKGADGIITGCTEIPLAMTEEVLVSPDEIYKALVIDPTQVLAEKLAEKDGVAGIAGGLGPFPTKDLMKKINGYVKDAKLGHTIDLLDQILVSTPAKKDQEHLPIVCTALRYKGVEEAKELEAVGVDFIVATRDWSRKELEEMQKEVGVPILNLVYDVRVNGDFEKKLAKCVVKYAEEKYKPPWR